MLLGVFESVCAPASYSLIADYFPPEIRTTANAYFAGCIFVGGALSSVSTIMVASIGWRETYLIVGIYGIVAGILVITFVQEPVRGRYDPRKVDEEIKEEVEQIKNSDSFRMDAEALANEEGPE